MRWSGLVAFVRECAVHVGSAEGNVPHRGFVEMGVNFDMIVKM